MKTNWSLKFTCLLAGMVMLITSGKVSAQWTTGSGGSALYDIVTVAGSNAMITGTLVATDPANIYYQTAHPAFPGGYAHYYQITTPVTSGAALATTFVMTDNSNYWPLLALLDANLNVLQAPLFSIIDTSSAGQTSFSYPLTSGSTYYIEASSYGKGTGAFTLQIAHNISTCIQVVQGTTGESIGLSSIQGSLSASDEASHGRAGGHADYFKLAGTGSTEITSSGFDTYLFLYDSKFKLIASNDDSNPPGYGGSRITGVMLSGTALTSGTTISPDSAAILTGSAAITSGSLTVITIGSGTVWASALGLPAIIIAGVDTSISSGTATMTTANGTTITTGSGSISTGTTSITSGAGTTIVPGLGATITTGSDWYYNGSFTAIADVTASIISSGSTNVSITTGSGSTITTGKQEIIVRNNFYVELTSYNKSSGGNYTLSTTKGGLVQVISPWDPTGAGSVNGSPVPLAYATAGTLTSGTMSHGRAGRYANYYQILTSATGAGATTITVAGFDSFLYVYDLKGKKIASNDDSNPPGGGGSRVNVGLKAGTSYTVEVTSYFIGAKNSYTLSVSSSKSSGTVTQIPSPF